MIYLFDKTQTLTGVIDEHTEALSATLEMKINEASTLDFALPLDDDLAEKMAGVKYVGVPSPNSADKIVFLRLMTINDETDRVEYMAKELAYQELSSSGYIEDKRPAESDAQTLMNIVLDGSGYKLGVVNVPGKVKTSFYYTDHLSAISNVVELLGGEIYFYVSITGSKITGHYMDYVAQQGTNTSKTFSDGSNLITVERKRDMSSVYTAILPRGKGEQVSTGKNDTPDGYGRRIDISGVTWSKANGNPLDKKSGDKILIDPDATAEYGNADGTPRLLLKTYDDIEDANILINKAYMDLMTMNNPAVQYSATVANVGDMQLGDTIVIMHSKRSMSYRTRVFHITYDLIDNTKTVAEFGNDLSKDSITSQINSISSNGATISDQVQWNISNGGHNNTSYGAQEPANPRKGDVWFKQLPNGNTEEYYFDGTVWVLGAKTDQQWQEDIAIAQGSQTTFYGTATPVGAVKGDVWFKNDNNVPDGKEMYTYSGTTWIKFNGAHDANRLTAGEINGKLLQITNVDTTALIGGLDGTKNPLSNVPADQLTGTMNKEVVNTISLNAAQITSGKLNSNIVNAMELNARQIVAGQIDASKINVFNLNADNIKTGTIDASKINVMNLSASNIVSGNLSANFLKGGQIDASQINVINLNANNIVAGTIDATKIGIVGKSSKLDLTGDSVKIKSTDSSIPWSATFNKNGVELVTQAAGNTVENVGGLRVLYASGDENTNGIYLALNKSGTPGEGFNGDEVGLAYSNGLKSDGTTSYTAAMLFNATGSGNKTPGFHFYDRMFFHGNNLNVTGSEFIIDGSQNNLRMQWVSWSSWFDGAKNPTLIASNGGWRGSGIAFAFNNLVAFTSGGPAKMLL